MAALINLENWHQNHDDGEPGAFYRANRWDSPLLFAQLTYTPGEDDEQVYLDARLDDGTLEDAAALIRELVTWISRVESGERYAHIEGFNPWEYTHYLTGTGARFCGWDPTIEDRPATPVVAARELCPNCLEAYRAHQLAVSMGAHPAGQGKGGGDA